MQSYVVFTTLSDTACTSGPLKFAISNSECEEGTCVKSHPCMYYTVIAFRTLKIMFPHTFLEKSEGLGNDNRLMLNKMIAHNCHDFFTH